MLIQCYYTITQAKDLLRAGFEPATYGFLPDTQLQSTALPTELSKVICEVCVREIVFKRRYNVMKRKCQSQAVLESSSTALVTKGLVVLQSMLVQFLDFVVHNTTV